MNDPLQDICPYNPRLAFVKDGNILLSIYGPDHEEPYYPIELHRCRTYQDIVGWTYHLGEKTWIDNERIRAFVHVACDANHLDIPCL